MKPLDRIIVLLQSWSHPVRVRGLKLATSLSYIICAMSHPVRVRGLKLFLRKLFPRNLRRTPCGCVG